MAYLCICLHDIYIHVPTIIGMCRTIIHNLATHMPKIIKASTQLTQYQDGDITVTAKESVQDKSSAVWRHVYRTQCDQHHTLNWRHVGCRGRHDLSWLFIDVLTWHTDYEYIHVCIRLHNQKTYRHARAYARTYIHVLVANAHRRVKCILAWCKRMHVRARFVYITY
jgi:hypothetical protein